MRLILSRKGFDSASGGCPSPILPDGSMIALPIPDRRSPTRYGDLTWVGHDLGEVVERLTRGKVKRGDGAHLDPDLRPELLERPAGWRPVLGQTGASQAHLENQAVGIGDVFLFWGLFREVDEAFRWRGPRRHVIWGWLEVGEILRADRVPSDGPPWLTQSRHPHLGRSADARNTLYVAAERAGGAPGAGVFERISPERILTAPGSVGPSTWSLPTWMDPAGRTPLSYHRSASRWIRRGENVLLESARRGQEFVLQTAEYPQAHEWIRSLVDRPQRARRGGGSGSEVCAVHDRGASARGRETSG